MTATGLIAANEFCTYHRVEFRFIDSLSEAGLLETRIVEREIFIPETELQKLEKMIRLHQELEINLAGIEAITHLLQRMEALQDEIRIMRNRLSRFEE